MFKKNEYLKNGKYLQVRLLLVFYLFQAEFLSLFFFHSLNQIFFLKKIQCFNVLSKQLLLRRAYYN